MSVHRRPPPRTRPRVSERVYEPIPEGHFLYSIINPKPTVYFEFKKLPVYRKDDYLRMLKKNNMEMGIPYTDPVYVEYTIPEKVEPPNEPHLEFLDQVKVNLRILKNGTIRVKINAAVASMFEKNKRPPIKVILQAYKSQGFSQKFLDRVNMRHNQRLEYAKRLPKIIDGIFNKEPVKKVKRVVKKKPEPEPEVEEEPPEEEEEEEDVIPPEDAEMDVEVEVDEEEQVDEYVSDVDE